MASSILIDSHRSSSIRWHVAPLASDFVLLVSQGDHAQGSLLLQRVSSVGQIAEPMFPMSPMSGSPLDHDRRIRFWRCPNRQFRSARAMDQFTGFESPRLLASARFVGQRGTPDSSVPSRQTTVTSPRSSKAFGVITGDGGSLDGKIAVAIAAHSTSLPRNR